MRRLLLAAALAALVASPLARAWTWPTDGPVLQPYSFDPNAPYAGGQHRGIDVAGDPGGPVRAPAAGEVTYVGTVPSSGRSLTITTADGYAVTLTHLGSTSVAKGATVAEGDVVGTIGPSGDPEVGDPYVHVGIRLASDAQGYVDPASLLPARAVAAPPAPDPAPAAPPSDPAPTTTASDPPQPAEPAPVVADPAADPSPAPVPTAPAPAPAAPAQAPAEPASAPVAVNVASEPTVPARPETAEIGPAPAAGLAPDPVGEIHAGAPPHRVTATVVPGPVAAVAAAPAREAPELRADVFVRALRPTTIRPRSKRPPTSSTVLRPISHREPLEATLVRGRVRDRSLPRSTAQSDWVVPFAALLALAILGAGAAAVARVARRRAPTMVGHAVLRDDAHLLRQRPSAHRSRLHDDRGGHPRAPSPAARRRDVLPHRRRRARDEGLARR